MIRRPGFLVTGTIAGVLVTSALVFAQVANPGPTPPATKQARVDDHAQREIDAAKEAPKKARAQLEFEGRRVVDEAKAKAAGFQKMAAQLKVAGGANLENLIQQHMRQARPIVRAELVFVRKVCSLEVEQFRRIHQDTEAAFKDAVTKIAEAQQQGRVRVAGQIQRAPSPSAIAHLHERLVSVMKKDLTPEQFARYQGELEKRDAFQKESAVRFLVDTIDREVYLSGEQRQKLTDSLMSHWDPSWISSLEYVLYGNRFFPAGIDPYVTPYLDQSQKKIWAGVQRVGGIGGIFPMLGLFVNDPDALGPELGEDKDGVLRKEAPPRSPEPPKAQFRKVQLRDHVAGEAVPKK